MINRLLGSEVISVRDSIWFFCEAETPVAEPLIFHWSCTRGRLIEKSQKLKVKKGERGARCEDSVKWFAPDSSGRAVIRVTVVDSRPDSVSDSLVVTVNPLVRSFISWDGAVKAGGYFFWSDSAWAGYRLSGACASDSTPTYLIFMDESNFPKWREGKPYEYLIRRLAYNRSPFYDTISQSGRYYLVIDNIRSSKDCGFWVNIWLTSP